MLENLEVEDDLDQLDSLQLLQILQKLPANEIVQRNGLFEEFMFALGTILILCQLVIKWVNRLSK